MIKDIQIKLKSLAENKYFRLFAPIVFLIIIPSILLIFFLHPFDIQRSFSIDVNPHNIIIGSEKNLTQATVFVNNVNGYGYQVSLSASGVPQNVEISFEPQYGVVPSFGSIMEIKTNNATKTEKDNSVPIKIIGNGSDNKNTSRTFYLTIE